MAVFASAAASVVPQALARFRQRHPGVELIVSVADPADSLPLVRAGELDIALCNSIDAGRIEGSARRGQEPAGLRLEHVHLFDDPMYVALPSGHPLANVPELRLGLLADEPWMLATRDSCSDAELFFLACAADGIEPRIAFQYDDYAALLGFVAAGVGISVIPDMIARGMREDVVVRSPSPALPSRSISAAIPAGYRSPAVTAKLETLQELVPDWVAGRVEPAQTEARKPATRPPGSPRSER